MSTTEGTTMTWKNRRSANGIVMYSDLFVDGKLFASVYLPQGSEQWRLSCGDNSGWFNSKAEAKSAAEALSK
jgi:hypothetical protein